MNGRGMWKAFTFSWVYIRHPGCSTATGEEYRIRSVLDLRGVVRSRDGSLAAEAGKLVEKDGKYVFVESMDPATKLLLERAVKQGTITQDEYQAVVRESQERAYLLQPSYKAWYDRGFN